VAGFSVLVEFFFRCLHNGEVNEDLLLCKQLAQFYNRRWRFRKFE